MNDLIIFIGAMIVILFGLFIFIRTKVGTGNLSLNGDFSMNNRNDTMTLIYSSSIGKWIELSRSDNGVSGNNRL